MGGLFIEKIKRRQKWSKKHHCQVLWAKNKSTWCSVVRSNIYKEIREYLKRDQVEVSHVEDLIQQALAFARKSWPGLQRLSAYLGLFQKQATPEEKGGLYAAT